MKTSGMRHRQRTWVLVALSALGMMLPACRNRGDLSCATDLDCLETEVCHPDQKVCVQLCTTSADCPQEAKTCTVTYEGARVKTCVQSCTKNADCPDTAKDCAFIYEGAQVKTCQCLSDDCKKAANP